MVAAGTFLSVTTEMLPMGLLSSISRDLDVCARSELGAALVELGRTREGTALLDEAMAGALGGEVQDLDAVVFASCSTITSCSRAADVKRATQWIRAAAGFNDLGAELFLDSAAHRR